MNAQNGDGAGLAWREADTIKWEKGLTLDEIKVFNAEVPMPYVLHFRLASCGGKGKEMTHPFPVEKDVSLALSGTIKGSVLFHNGHWGRFRDQGLEAAVRNKVRVPDGGWSDTRVMAWMTYLHGPGILEFIDEKAILFSPKKIEIFHPDLWVRVNDLLVSNRLWENQWSRQGYHHDEAWDYMHGKYTQVCRWGNCKNPILGNTFNCAEHQPPCKDFSCTKPRVGGSEHCEEHQGLCKADGCLETREPGETLCLKHLVIPPNKLAKKPEPGGDSGVVPFRNGSAMVSGGDDQQGRAEGATEGVGSVGKELPRAPLPPTITIDARLQGHRRWACSLNPKAIRTPHAELRDILAEHSGAKHLM